MAQNHPLPGELYRHFKNRVYQIITIAYHSETMERYVVYQALYGDFKTYVRPYDMFISEVDHEKYPDVEQKYRFTYIGNAAEARQEEKKEQKPEQEPEQDADRMDSEPVNPWLERFLDAEEFDEKYKIICDMEEEVTERLIDDIAVVMDFSIPQGDLSDRYEQLKYCMRTRSRYENSRLR